MKTRFTILFLLALFVSNAQVSPIFNDYSLQFNRGFATYGIYSNQSTSAVFGVDMSTGNSAGFGAFTNGDSEAIIHGSSATEVTLRANDTLSYVALNSPNDTGKMIMIQDASRFTINTTARSGLGMADRGIKIEFPSYSEYDGAGFFTLYPPKKTGVLAVQSNVTTTFCLCNGSVVTVVDGIITNISIP